MHIGYGVLDMYRPDSVRVRFVLFFKDSFTVLYTGLKPMGSSHPPALAFRVVGTMELRILLVLNFTF